MRVVYVRDQVTLPRSEYNRLRAAAARQGKPKPVLMTVAEVAAVTSLSADTVRRLVKSGRLKAARLSPGTLRIWNWSVREWLESELQGEAEEGPETARSAGRTIPPGRRADGAGVAG